MKIVYKSMYRVEEEGKVIGELLDDIITEKFEMERKNKEQKGEATVNEKIRSRLVKNCIRVKEV